jgi:threonine dehydratase
MLPKDVPDRAALFAAHRRVKPFIHRTPILTSRSLNRRTGARVFCKAENLQRGGAFKIRGALNNLLSKADQIGSAGVCTHSSGNHAQALALAAGENKIPAHIVMPENAAAIKVAAVRDYGGHIYYCGPTQQQRETKLAEVIASTGALPIHPYDDWDTICGQATASIELLTEAPQLELILAPVGGGGLLSGAALACAYLAPGGRVFGCEPALADDARQSLLSGKRLAPRPPQTIADGLRTGLGARPWQIIQTQVTDIFTVSEEEIVSAMHWVWERMKIVIEVSAAVAFAVLFARAKQWAGKNIGVIISGGNTDLHKLPWLERN